MHRTNLAIIGGSLVAIGGLLPVASFERLLVEPGTGAANIDVLLGLPIMVAGTLIGAVALGAKIGALAEILAILIAGSTTLLVAAIVGATLAFPPGIGSEFEPRPPLGLLAIVSGLLMTAVWVAGAGRQLRIEARSLRG